MLASLTVSACGFAGMIAGSILAQTTAPGSDLGPWVAGSSASICAAALAYAFRALLTGRMVSRDVQAEIDQLKSLAQQLATLVDKVSAIAEASAERERSYHRLLLNRLESKRGHPLTTEE